MLTYCHFKDSSIWEIVYKWIIQKYRDEISDLPSEFRSKVIIFGFLGPKNLKFNIYHAKIVNSKFWPLIIGCWLFDLRGHLVTSKMSKWKNNVIFGFLGPINLHFNIYHAKFMNSKFWPLIRGQRSFGDLYEVEMKK